MTQKIITTIGVLVAIVALGYFGPRPILKKSTKLETVKVGQLQLIGNWPFYLAEHQNFFQKSGIKVEYVNFQSSNQAMDALIRGDIDVSYLGSLPVLAAQTTEPNKVKIFAFGDYNQKNPFDALLIKSDSKVKSLNELAGKKIGVFPGTTGTNFVRTYLQNQGVDTKTIQFVQLPPPAQLQALESGAIDALHAYELNTAIGLDKGTVKKLSDAIFAQVLDGAAIGVAVARTDWINQHPKLAKKTADAFQQGVLYGRDHQDITRSIVRDRFSLTDSVSQKITLLDWIMADEYNYQLFDQLATLSTEIGDLTTRPDISDLRYK